jgi:type IV pilus assembly protein PilC
VHITYVAIDERGQEVAGGLEADTPTVAAAELKRRGLFPVEVVAGAAGQARARGLPRLPRPVRTADLVLFCSQLALMLRTGLPLLEALHTLGERASAPALAESAARVAQAVQAGRSLSEALEAEGRRFPPLLVHLVRTAEVTGELDQAFQRAADELERRAALRRQVVSSLLYPAIVVVVALGVFWFLTAKVVPKIARFLQGRGLELPWTTQFLVDASAFLRAHGVAIGAGATLLGIAAFALYRTPRGRRTVDRAVLRIPLLGAVLRAAALTNLSRTLVLGGTFTNRCYAESVETAAEQVVRGRSLTEALQGPGISPLVTQVLGVGERSGSLDEVLAELADHYERRLQALLKTLAGLIEPALLVVVGGLVGLVYLSFFQAVFQLAAR